jgi:hypothetical protein
MPDPLLIVTAMSASLVVSALLSAFIDWPLRLAWTSSRDAGWVIGIGAGFLIGCWLLGMRPHWPPREDLDRLLILVIPALVLVDLLASFSRISHWLIWPLRLIIWGSIARILLHGTSYITDTTGPGTSEWSSSLAWFILGGLGVLAGTVWALLSVLARRAPGFSVPLCLSITIAAAAVTIMLSGYASGGQIGLPLAAAILGATGTTLVLTRGSRGVGPLGIPIFGLFSLLAIGRFFGELTSLFAILLFCAPLLGWLPEIPFLLRLPSWARGLTRVILVSATVSTILFLAHREFDRVFQTPTGASSSQPSLDDYLHSGK